MKRYLLKNSRLKRIANKDGYVTPVAMVMMVLLMAFGAGMLMMAYYNYADSVARYEEKQAYFYCRNIIQATESKITAGVINQSIVDVVDAVDADLNGREDYKGTFGSEYTFKAELEKTLIGEEKQFIKNSYNGDNVSVDMEITYYPKGREKTALGGIKENYVGIGDLLKIKYIVTKESNVRAEGTKYMIIGTYMCRKDGSKNPDGTVSKVKEMKDMEWEAEEYTQIGF